MPAPISTPMASATKEQIQHEALSRAAQGQSFANWPAIFAGFTAKGIPETEIKPRENIFTYHAWRALGRQVRRGEHGVAVGERELEREVGAPGALADVELERLRLVLLHDALVDRLQQLGLLFGQQLFDGVHPFVFDGDDQVSGFAIQ